MGPGSGRPPETAPYQPIANPYYNPACNLDDPATWQYQTDPFCEPQLIPGTPNISVGMEQFNDTPIVNGTAYRRSTWNQRPTASASQRGQRPASSTSSGTCRPENGEHRSECCGAADRRDRGRAQPAELAAAQTDPVVFPTPDTTFSPAGPSWIQIGSEGGFLPAPVVVPNQPITWITDPNPL